MNNTQKSHKHTKKHFEAFNHLGRKSMKYKDLILFIVITFLRSIFISMLKFFLRSYLKEAHITLEAITGYLSL